MMPHPNISLGLTTDFGKMNKVAGPSFQKTAFFSCSRFLQTLFFRSNSSRFVKYIFSKKKKIYKNPEKQLSYLEKLSRERSFRGNQFRKDPEILLPLVEHSPLSILAF